MSDLYPVRNTTVLGEAARATFPRFGPATAFLFDGDHPKADPNDIYRMQGRYTDPHSVNHNCPFCTRTMSYDLFVAHAEACFRKWRKVTLNKTRRKFAGASVEIKSTSIEAPPASASGGGTE